MELSISLMTDDEVLKDSRGLVRLPGLLNYRFADPKPIPGGLFCEKIFGPVNSYECSCGALKGFFYKNTTCQECGVYVTKNTVRSEWMGHIDFLIPMIHPLAQKLVFKIFRTDPKNEVKKQTGQTYTEMPLYGIIPEEDKKGSLILKDGRRCKVTYIFNNTFKEDNSDTLDKNLVYTADLFEQIDFEKTREVNKPLDNLIKQGVQVEKFVIRKLLVCPPNYRPVVFTHDRWVSHSFNTHYSRIIKQCNRIEELLSLTKLPRRTLIIEQFLLQKALNGLFLEGTKDITNTYVPSITETLAAKGGLIRSSMLGKRVDYSGRSVIVPDPALRVDELKVPIKMVRQLFLPYLINAIIKKKITSSVQVATRIAKESDSDEIFDILEEVIQDKRVLLNRAPSLHRYSIQAFKIQLTQDNAIHMPNCNMAPFNADADGDCVAIHVPISKEALEDVEKMNPIHNMTSSASGMPLMTPSHEMVIGGYFMTQIKYPNESPKNLTLGEIEYMLQTGNLRINEEIIYNKERTTSGRVLLENILEVRIKEPLTNKSLKKCISESSEFHSNKDMITVLHDLQMILLYYGTKISISICKSDIIKLPSKQKLIEETQNKVKKLTSQGDKIRLWTQTFNKLQDEMLEVYGPDNSLMVMLNSGARVSKVQVSQLTVAKGLISRGRGDIIEQPVVHSLKEGLLPIEFFCTCHGSRKSLADKFFLTPKSGYLARRLVSAARDLYIDTVDCGTTLGIKLKKKYCEGRFTVSGEMIGKNNSDEIIEIRSPITCEANSHGGICQRCYGIEPGLQDLVMNYPVGVIAAQSVSEPTTQLTMRTFHFGGVAEVRDNPLVIIASISGRVDIAKIDKSLTSILVENESEDRRYMIHHNSADILVKTDGIVKKGDPIVLYRQDVVNTDIGGKLPVLEFYFEKRKTLETCITATSKGIVDLIPDENSIQIIIDGEVQGRVKDLPVFVAAGDFVTKGTPMTYGEIDLRHYWKKLGLKDTGGLFVNKLLELYGEEGIKLFPVHLEVIFRSMTELIKLENGKLGLRRLDSDQTHKVLLEGITKISRDYPSFFKCLGFGWLKHNLINHAVRGSTTYDLPCERIMSGKLLPYANLTEG